MTAEPLPDPKTILGDLEGAFAGFDEARVRLHNACSGAAKGLLALGDRVAQLERELEGAQGTFTRASTEGTAERDSQALRIAALEGELAALKEAHEKSSEESATLGAATVSYNQKIGELEGTVAALTEHMTKLALERDAHGQHGAAVEGELIALREELAKRPGVEYVAAVEREKSQVEEDLARARVELDKLRADFEKMKAELSEARVRVKKTSSSTRLPAAAPPPVPEAKAFAQTSAAPREKPPGALDVEELLRRAKTVKKPGG